MGRLVVCQAGPAKSTCFQDSGGAAGLRLSQFEVWVPKVHKAITKSVLHSLVKLRTDQRCRVYNGIYLGSSACAMHS